MVEGNVLINRAPVLTLWASTVAERLGFDQHEALSLGKVVAGLTAQSKGQRLGIYKPATLEVRKGAHENEKRHSWSRFADGKCQQSKPRMECGR
jgi:hypothetical protein